MILVTAELATCGTSNVIDVHFPYSVSDVERVRTVVGRRFVSSPGAHWHIPLDMEACRGLRIAFGDRLDIGPNLYSWAVTARRNETKLGGLALASTATLERLPTVLPALYEAIHLGPLGKHMTSAQRAVALTEPASYQAADVAYLAHSPAPLNGNEQGTGKTIEWIAAIWEAGLEKGTHLIVCPKVAIDGTWEGELAHWQRGAPCPVEIFPCVDDRDNREEMIDWFKTSTADVKWVVVNPAMLQWRKDITRQGKHIIAVKGKKTMDACHCDKGRGPHEHYTEPYPELFRTRWSTICIDEAHKGMIRNRQSLTATSMKKLVSVHKRCAMSGTPMKKLGGADIFGTLQYLNPKVFTSYWRFVEGYFNTYQNDAGYWVVGELLEDKRSAFWESLKPYMLRRLKSEVAPWLPPKHYIEVACPMLPEQEAQYRAMEKTSCADLAGDEISTTGVLDHFVRLKQFANALCKVDKATGDIVPVKSNKVEAMLQKMDEAGMFDDGSDRKQVVFSQSERMVRYVAEILRAKGLIVDVISGQQNRKSADRKRLIKDFQDGPTRVLVIVTTAGGVSLTLDAASEAHMIDEMWSPDEDEQAEDRIHRVSRIHQVTIFNYRSIDTVDQYIQEVKGDKALTHKFILDVRRQLLAASHV